MSAQQAYYYPQQPTMPIAVAGKSSYHVHPHPQNAYRLPSASPPEAPYSSTASGTGSTVPSYSASSSSYGGSTSGDYDAPASSVDLMDLLNDRMANVYDPMPMDRQMVNQAQTSGALNAKQRELLELQALAQSRLASTRANFADGMKAAKEVKRDLEWTQKRVTALKGKAERKHPKQYEAARARYPSPEY